jgi:hypothetical protein
VTHYDVSEKQIDAAIEVIGRIMKL